jgi:hypothetical protein
MHAYTHTYLLPTLLEVAALPLAALGGGVHVLEAHARHQVNGGRHPLGGRAHPAHLPVVVIIIKLLLLLLLKEYHHGRYIATHRIVSHYIEIYRNRTPNIRMEIILSKCPNKADK